MAVTATELKEKHCTPCEGGVPPLSAKEIKEQLAALPDWKLTADRGDVKAARGDPEGALADWSRAHELNPGDFGPVYSSAFLLEHEGRLAEAIGAWRHILEYADAHDWELTAVWPRQELQRLQKLLDDRQHPGR